MIIVLKNYASAPTVTAYVVFRRRGKQILNTCHWRHALTYVDAAVRLIGLERARGGGHVDNSPGACCAEPDRHRLGARRVSRIAARAEARRLDDAVPGDHDSDQRYRLCVAVRPRPSVAYRGRDITARAGDCAGRALPLPSRRAVALDLRGDGGDRALSQRLCRGGAGVPESAVPQSPGADAVG